MSTALDKPRIEPGAAGVDDVVREHGEKRPHRLLTLALQIGVFVGGCALWQVLADTETIDPFFFSRPSDIASQIWRWIVTGYIWPHLAVTLLEAMLAFVIGTIAGVAAGTFARMDAPPPATVGKRKKIGIWKADQEVDLALIDVAVCREPFVGARAVVDIAQVKDIVIAEVRTEVIGLASIASFLGALKLGRTQGLYIQLSNQEKPAREIKAPIAPGLVARIPVKAWRKIEVGEPLTVDPEESVIALDGEREIEVTRESRFRIILSQDGPRVIEVGPTLQAAIDRGMCS